MRAIAAILVLPTAAAGADRYWNVASGDWATATNWGGAAPNTSEYAYVVNGGTATVTVAGAACYVLNLGTNAGSGTVQMLNGGLATTSDHIGYYGIGNFAQSGGIHTTEYVTLAFYPGTKGTYDLSGSAELSVSRYEYVGYADSGTFLQSGGSNTAYYVSLGENRGTSGVYDLSNQGRLTASFVNVGNYGGGVFTQSGGTATISSSLYLAHHAGDGDTRVYNLNGGMLSAGYEYVGQHGEGTFNQYGGSNAVGSLYLGSGAGCTGSYNLSGSAQLSANGEYLGVSQGSGTFTQAGGTNSAGSLQLSYYPGSGGTYNLNGGLLAISALTQGSGSAAFNFSGGMLRAGASFSTSVPMTLGTGGRPEFDTNGYNVTLSGPLSGPGSLAKMGNGTLTLAATSSYGGDTAVAAGTLCISQNIGTGLADLSDVLIVSGALLDLEFTGTDTIRWLYLDGIRQNQWGTWGAIGSGAQHEDPHFAGPGLLLVTAVPEPSTLALLGLAALGLLGYAWRRKRA